ncbi:DUF3021 domain-containing protein [Streptococcus orisratti]|uniref:hypothetical protein n=1 Tax=Streptococcus orisratti TaxID=114652 RepID=UPI00036C9EEE|nr:hypothetical protein [Streptococcus orisratti]MDY5636074.1 DUF3021 domain-containing protein [Streptococcus orisratti]
MKTKWWEGFLSQEIANEYKTAVYCFCVYFFYSAYQLLQGRTTANIYYLIEMVIVTYVITQIQVFLFNNFDEADRLARRELLGLIVCSCLYGLVGQWLSWFDGNLLAAACFVIYVMLEYLTIFIANKIKRSIDSKKLNIMLDDYKSQRK